MKERARLEVSRKLGPILRELRDKLVIDPRIGKENQQDKKSKPIYPLKRDARGRMMKAE